MEEKKNVLERVEWTQYWAESCDEDKPRALLIGDSISVGYRHAVYERIKDKYCIVTISTSKAVDNTNFLKEIEFLADEEGYEYKVIHFNNGIHGYHLPTSEYAVYYEKAVKFFLDKYPEAKLILCTSTPNTIAPENVELAPWNKAIVERNEIVKALALKYGLEIDNLYAVADNNRGIIADDGVHYTIEGYEVLADKVAEVILK